MIVPTRMCRVTHPRIYLATPLHKIYTLGDRSNKNTGLTQVVSQQMEKLHMYALGSYNNDCEISESNRFCRPDIILLRICKLESLFGYSIFL